MQKLTFKRNKYGKELLFDTVHTDNFGLELEDNVLLPTFYSIACLRESQGILKIGTEQIRLQNQSILFIPEGQTVYLQKANFKEGIFLFFEKEFLDTFFNEENFIYKFSFFHNIQNPNYLYLESSDFVDYDKIFRELHQEIQNLKNDSEHLIRSILYYFLIKVNRIYAQTYQFSDGQMLQNRHLIDFRALLEQEIRRKQTVQAYADMLSISRIYLNKLCHEFYHKTAIEVIKDRLLFEAKKELLYSKKTIAEIAYELSFSAPAHFTRFFKTLTEQTPQEYKSQLSKW